MIDQWHISFEVKLLSSAHVGSGALAPIADVRRDHAHLKIFRQQSSVEGAESRGLVALVQRDFEGKPVIEASSLRGAMRALSGVHAEFLFGPETVGEENDWTGALWLNAGRFQRLEDAGPPSQLPFWDADKSTYILTGNRIDRESGAEEDGLLYMTEYSPAGTVFRFGIVFEGTREQVEARCLPVFARMATKDGFLMGRERGYGTGRAQLSEGKLAISGKSYNASIREFETISDFTPDLEKVDRSSDQMQLRLTLRCQGPFFIQDPYRKQHEKSADMLALGTNEFPVLTGKAVLQELRRRTAWIECIEWLSDPNNKYDYEKAPNDDPDFLLKPDAPVSSLPTAAQRLFGVAGWGKIVRIHSVSDDAASQVYKAHALKLDAFTQAPIDGALIEYDVPADVSATIVIEVDFARYRGGIEQFQNHDLGLLRRAILSMREAGRSPGYGHAASNGFGNFSVVSIELPDLMMQAGGD
jgi:RAMP superfamily